MLNYAQLNEDGIVVCVSQLSGEIEMSDMIRIDQYNPELCGKKYENGEFLDNPNPQPEIINVSQEELTKELLLETKYQTALLELSL